MVDVFISYAKSDRPLVEMLAREIARAGYLVWWDDDIPPHLSYGEVITEKIGSARAAIVVWSRTAAASEWVRAEADMAREQRKLIQSSIDGGTPPLPFNQIQWAELDGWTGETNHPGWRKVKTSLLALCGPPSSSNSDPGTVPLAPAPEPTTPTAPAVLLGTTEAPARKRAIGAGAIAAALGILLLLGLSGYLLLGRGEAPVATAAKVNATAPDAPAAAMSPRPAPPAARFTQAAVLTRREGSQAVYIGPAESPVVVTNVRAGEALTTYAQTGDWWQVRTADGIVGYLRRADLRLLDSAGASETSETPGGGTDTADANTGRPFQLDGAWRMTVAPADGNRDRTVRGRVTISGRSASFALARGGETRARGRCSVARRGASRVRFDCTNTENGSREAFDLAIEDARTMRGMSRDNGNPVRIRMSRR